MKKLALLLALALPSIAAAQSTVINGSRTYTSGASTREQVANDGTTGTTVNLLAKLTSTGAVKATISDTNVAVAIVEAGAGTTGNAEVAVAGNGNCIMDGTASNTEGFYVYASQTTDGRCHAQNTQATGFLVGVLVSNSTTSGSTAVVHVLHSFTIVGAGSGTVTSVATTSPISGGTITTSGTLTCPTCVTSAASLTDNSPVLGSGGGQGTKTVAGITSDGAGKLTLGVAGSTVGTVDLKNATSGTLTVTPPTGALGTVTNTLQAASDTFVYRATTDTLTNKTLDAEGTGNTVTIPVKVWLPAAGCNNATAGTFWDLPTATPAVAACVTGTNIQKGVLQFADTTGGFSAQNTLILPADFTGNIDARIIWRTSATTGNAKWSLSTICTDVAATATDDPAFNTASTVTTAAPGTANRIQTSSISSVTITGCSAGNLLHVKIFRDGNDASDTIAATAELLGIELTIRRAM